MATTIETLKSAVYGWVSSTSNITTIFANQNIKRPTAPYALINILSINQVGTEESVTTVGTITNEDDEEVEVVTTTYSAMQEITVSINTFYKEAFQTALTIRDSINNILVTDYLNSVGLGYYMATPVTRMPENIDEMWEERAHFDVIFYYRFSSSFSSEVIKSIQLENELTGQTITIPPITEE